MTKGAAAIASYAKHTPLALCAVATLWAIGLTSHAILRGPTPSLLAAANLGLPVFNLHGTWYPLASRIWCADLAGYLVTSLILIAFFVPAERNLGSRRTATIFIWTLLGTTAISIAVAAISAEISAARASSLQTASAVGPSVGAFGVILAFSHTLSPLSARRLRVIVLVTLATLALYSGRLQDVSRLIAALIGLCSGPLLVGSRGGGSHRLRREGIEPQERRLLVSFVVAAAAAGPFLLMINRVASRWSARLRELWIAPSPERAVAHNVCRIAAAPHTCYLVHGYVTGRGVGADIRMVLPVLIALALAEGLRRGYHSAYVGALGFHVLLAGAAMVSSLTRALAPSAPGGTGRFNAHWLPEISADLVPAVVALLIYWNRNQFRVRSPRGTYLRLFQIIFGALVGASVVYILGGYALRAQFDRAFSLRDLLWNLPSRFLPPTYLGLVRPRFYPLGTAAGQLSDWTGAVFWLIALLGLLYTFRRGGVLEHNAAPDRIRRLLLEHGGSNLAYMSTWAGHEHWIAADGRTAFAYRVVSSVAITTGGPLGDPAAQATALFEFEEFCTARGWAVCLFCVSEEFAPVIQTHGWHALEIATDAVIPLTCFELSGRKLQDARTAINRAQRRGVSATWIDLVNASPAVVEQIESMGRDLRNVRATPELAFTLGGVPEMLDTETRCLAAIDKDGAVHGIVSWIPVYRSGATLGWTLDVMRRSSNCFKGVMDFLIASAVLSFKADGYEFVSLSGVPLSRGAVHPRTLLDGALRRIGGLLNAIFGFDSLLAFKDKFQPTYRALYLLYRDGFELPRIAYAIGRAYVPEMTIRQALGIGRRALIRVSQF